MRERPILFSGSMIRAILSGSKSQTRRLVKSPHASGVDAWCFDAERGAWEGGVYGDGGAIAHGEWVRCPYGVRGDRLWVRETHGFLDPDFHPTTMTDRGHVQVTYRADHVVDPKHGDGPDQIRWRPSIFMPRWASRITLEVTEVRVERLQAIKPGDILAEGAVERPHQDVNLGKCPVSAFDGCLYPDLTSLWAKGWDRINGKRSPWSSNPWVFVISFRRLP